MEWIIAVSPEERAQAALSADKQREAQTAFDQHGCLLLRGAFSSASIDAMYQEYLSRYGTMTMLDMQQQSMRQPPNPFLEVGAARYEITLRMSGAFARPEVFANPLLLKFLTPLLGGNMRLSGFTTVVSHPGSTLQHIHRDHDHLYADASLATALPVYGVNVTVPLIDVDLETGPTGVWPGSHRMVADFRPPPETVTAIPFQRGDAVFLDYRTLHTGLPNRSTRVRPIIYMVYARTWFFDDVNHTGRPSLDMPLEDYAALPEAVRPLLTRAYSQAMRARWHEVDIQGRAAAGKSKDPANWSKVGRNDACPCGSGKKYKQCHGRAA
jgi:ectoine hydroxylase-related dioxygenase (phytanoyl-CoA dioxygenase family)